MVCHNLDKFAGHWHCDSGNLMFLMGHVTSIDHMFKGLYDVIGGSPSW